MSVESLLQAIRHDLANGGRRLAQLQEQLGREVSNSQESHNQAFQAAVAAFERAGTFVSAPDSALMEYAFAAEVLDAFGEEQRLNYAASLGNVGVKWQEKGDLDEALRFQTLAREFKERLAPNSLAPWPIPTATSATFGV